jgi:protein-disulfide isomerase
MPAIVFKAEWMKYFTKIVLAALVILPLTIAGASLTNAQAKPNWLLTFTPSAKGGHIIGNPAATTKVVEYASYTCGHCGEFEVNDAPVLKNQYVASGKVSFEIRNLVRDPLDLTAAMLARCGGKGRFFGNHARLMATQGQWANDAKLSKATQAKWQADNVTGFMQAAYTELGLATIMQARGITAAQAKVCLADKAALDQILAMTSEATGPLGLTGTPSFLVNGKVVKAHDLAELKAYLK